MVVQGQCPYKNVMLSKLMSYGIAKSAERPLTLFPAGCPTMPRRAESHIMIFLAQTAGRAMVDQKLINWQSRFLKSTGM